MAKVKIVLHGALKEAYPHDIELEAPTARVAMTGLKMIPALNPANNRNRYRCRISGIDNISDLDERLEVDTLHVYCEAVLNTQSIHGRGNNPYIQIIVGVILVIVGVWLMGSDSGAIANMGLGLVASGFGVIFGGITQLLMSDPKAEDQEKNKSLTGFENTVRAGTPIPLILGEHLHGGHIFSMNVETRYGKNLDVSAFINRFAPGKSESWIFLHDGTDDSNTRVRAPGGGGGGGGPEDNYYFPQLQR